MHPPTGRTMLDVDTILGLPRPTKKPSSLRKPRQPPPPKHINKERALAIAKKFKIKQIGKVSVRAGDSDALDDQPRVSLQSEKVLTRRILLDREKGLETAMNTKDSAVGKCILGRNNYETRRLGVEFEKLNEDIDRKSYLLLKRKSVFVHQRGLTLTQGGIVFDPNADTKSNCGSSDSPDPAKPLPGIQTTDNGISGEYVPGPTRDKSPSYMRPLSCERTRSTNSLVAEAERFLSSPSMMRYTTPIPDEDSTIHALKSASKVNTLDVIGHLSNNDTSLPPRRSFRTETDKVRGKSELQEIAESVASEGSKSDNVFGTAIDLQVGNMKFKNEENFPITTIFNRSNFKGQTDSKLSIEVNIRRRSNAFSGSRRTTHEQTFRKPSKPDQTREVNESEEAGTRGRHFRRRSPSKSSMLTTTSFPFKHKRTKHRKNGVSFSKTTDQFNTATPSKDPRFTELTSFLVPDSAKAFDLYRAMGRLSVLERLEESGYKSSGLRTKMGKIGQIRKSTNLKTFAALF